MDIEYFYNVTVVNYSSFLFLVGQLVKKHPFWRMLFLFIYKKDNVYRTERKGVIK